MVAGVQKGFNKGLNPKLVLEGVSGTYFLRDNCRNLVALMKCVDEEAYTPNNPKGFVGKFG